METLARAQEQHDAASPMKAMMDAMGGGQGQDMSSMGQGQEMGGGGAMDSMSAEPEAGAFDSMSSGIDNSEPSF
jgi:hypothetical protein